MAKTDTFTKPQDNPSTNGCPGQQWKSPEDAQVILEDISKDFVSSKTCDSLKSSPINATQMSMCSWYSRRYELKNHLSKLELMKMFSLSMIICKTFTPYMLGIDSRPVSSEPVSSEEAL